jgi:hypothetical protein
VILQFQYYPEWFQDEEDGDASDDWNLTRRQRSFGLQIQRCKVGIMKKTEGSAGAEPQTMHYLELSLSLYVSSALYSFSLVYIQIPTVRHVVIASSRKGRDIFNFLT